MNRLNNEEYQKRKREELEGQFRKGDLDQNMEPYLQWLKGERDEDVDYSVHRLAQDRIKWLNRYMTLKQISQTSKQYSYTAILNIYHGRFGNVRKEYAKSIYYNLKRVVDNIHESS